MIVVWVPIWLILAIMDGRLPFGCPHTTMEVSEAKVIDTPNETGCIVGKHSIGFIHRARFREQWVIIQV